MMFPIRIAFLLSLVATPCLAVRATGEADSGKHRPPNIVLIVADDQGYGEMHCQGGDLPTPNLDRLAASGVRFTSGYVSAPLCSPSRAGFLTGRYQQRFGHEINPVEKMNDRPDVGLPLSQKTIADYLRSAGYATGMFGKWHLGTADVFHPLNRGFEEFFGFLREGHYYLLAPFDNAPNHVISHLRAREPEYNRLNPILRGRLAVDEEEYLTKAFAREALGFIDRHKGHPFFLYVPFNAPHSPMQSTPQDYARFPNIADEHRRVWAGMIASLDDNIGRILDKLSEDGLAQDTLIFFLSDNGGPTEELTSRNDPLSGGKGSLWEGGIRIPFMASWPGHIPVGQVYNRPIISLDILSTALAAARAPLPTDVKLDGVNLLPFLTKDRSGDPHESLYWRLQRQIAIRQGDWKLVRANGSKKFQLFNLADDIGEKNDLSEQDPQRVKKLTDDLMHWNSELIAPLWVYPNAATTRAAMRADAE
jgi:arylsulfatase B